MNKTLKQPKRLIMIEKLNTFDLPDKVKKADGYDLKSLPEPTPENMLIYMEKINELIEIINDLKMMQNEV
jgi:hypothetical protein